MDSLGFCVKRVRQGRAGTLTMQLRVDTASARIADNSQCGMGYDYAYND